MKPRSFLAQRMPHRHSHSPQGLRSTVCGAALLLLVQLAGAQTPTSTLTLTPTASPAPALPAAALTASRSLSLQYVLDTALQAHPSVQAARLEMRASAEDQRAVGRQRWPTLSAVMENKSPNTAVVYTRLLRVEQTLWDAGRLSSRINEAGAQVDANQARVYLTSQQLALQIISAWQTLMTADGRALVAKKTIQKLTTYQEQMQRRVESEASPQIDLELVNSRILQTQVELTQAQNAHRVALGKLEQYSGLEGLTRLSLEPVFVPSLMQLEMLIPSIQQTDWVEIARQHPSVQKARQDAAAAQHRIESKRAEQYPQVYVRIDQPINSPVSNDIAGFVGLRYSPGAGFSSVVEAQALSTRMASLEQAVDAAMRDISESLYSDRDELTTNWTRIQALQKAVKGSEAVLDSYSRQFTASRKTWLDLMNAVRELAQNEYAMVDSHSAMTAALYRLQVRMGETVQPLN